MKKMQHRSRATSRLTIGLLTAGLLAAFSGVARAQIGSGWTQYKPNSEIQIEVHDKYIAYPANTTSINNGGVRYSNSGGVETYQLVNPTSNRVERRWLDDYGDRRQFQCDVMVSAGNNEKITQIFGGSNPHGPYILVGEYTANGGSITIPGNSHSLTVTGIFGKWVRMNTVHDKAKNITAVYINGRAIYTSGWGKSQTYYTKYGCYGTLSTPSAKIQFKNVKMFK